MRILWAKNAYVSVPHLAQPDLSTLAICERLSMTIFLPNNRAGFLLFRVFDVLKPWPISFVDEHVAGGLGIMLDDVLAAMAAWGVLQIMVLIVFFVPKG